MAEMLPSYDSGWRRRYNSPPDDLIADFYTPAFACSCTYDRAVGFFSSALLAAIAPSLDSFVLRGGRMRLITSPANLSDSDLEAMGKGEELKEKLRRDIQSAIIEHPIPAPVLADRLRLLTWMIATGKLEVQIALREHPRYYSLFHEKIGVFADEEGNWMTFTGSPNETLGGAIHHSESFPLHRSWISEDQRAFAAEERERFNQVWGGCIEGIATWTVNEWILEPMRAKFGFREPSHDLVIGKVVHETMSPLRDALLPRLPSGFTLRDYQSDAVARWLDAGGRGTFAMATGTGKTATALAAAVSASLQSAKTNKPLLVLVIAPMIDLVEQWRRDAEWFGFRPAVCHSGISESERAALKGAFSAARSTQGRRTEMVITTAGSLTPSVSVNSSESEHFLQRQLSRHNAHLMVIGDEMHALGTSPRLAALPRSPTFTLGLSATPKRHGDELGTQALLEYFGAPVIAISIKDAILKYKVLVPYDYFPLKIELTAEERKQYRVISQRIAMAYANHDEDAAEVQIRARVRLTQHAENKLVRLRQLMADGLKDAGQQIIYIAEGKNPGTDEHQLDQITAMLRDEFSMRVEPYHSGVDSARRQTLQSRLTNGDVQALIAMKCLDEGIDIPSVRIGIITASTQNPRQFIQRRGRLLRRDPKSPKSHAVIYDFIVVPPQSDGEHSDAESRLIGMELSRAVEMADAARNREVRFEIIEWAYESRLRTETYSWMRAGDLGRPDDMEDLWT